jgi:hypothetical protein
VELGQGGFLKGHDIFVYGWPIILLPCDFLFDLFHMQSTAVFNLG